MLVKTVASLEGLGLWFSNRKHLDQQQHCKTTATLHSNIAQNGIQLRMTGFCGLVLISLQHVLLTSTGSQVLSWDTV